MLIHYPDGRVELGVLIHASPGAMRVALSPESGPVTFTRSAGQWSSETHGPVKIDFTFGGTSRDWNRFCDHLIGLDEQPPWDADSLLAGCLPWARPRAAT
jgi:hypothetical protein